MLRINIKGVVGGGGVELPGSTSLLLSALASGKSSATSIICML